MALNGLFCADVPLRNYSLTHSPSTILDELKNNTCILTVQIPELE